MKYQRECRISDLSLVNNASVEIMTERTRENMIRLNVPYKEKDLAKAEGAKWNPDLKTWYINDIELLPKLSKWVEPYNVVCENMYIFQMKRICWKCKQKTDVVCLGSNESYSLESNHKRNSDVLLFSYVKTMPIALADYMKDKFDYFPSYSKTVNYSYYINHCKHCKSVQGDNFLHEVPEESFYKKLCYRDSEPTFYSKVNNQFSILLDATLPYYNEISSSMELMLLHMQTEVENRASLGITQKLMNNLLSVSSPQENININGL